MDLQVDVQRWTLVHGRWALSLCCLGIFACDPRSDQTDVDANTCTLSIGGVEHFLGTPECFNGIPAQRMAGYWVVAFEYSVFYDERQLIKQAADDEAITLLFAPHAGSIARKYRRDAEPQVFELEMVASRSDSLGLYGTDVARGGIYVREILSLKEVHMPK